MKFNITGKMIWNEVRNYVALFFELLGWLLSLPSALCNTIAFLIKSDDDV